MSFQLSHDVLIEIIHFVHDIDRSTVFSLNVVNNTLHSISLPFVYRECSFDFTDGARAEDIQRIQTWIRPHSGLSWVVSAIRQIALRKSVSDGEVLYFGVEPNTWAPFLSLISKTKNLSKLIFSIPYSRFPAAFLSTLETCNPNVSLVIEHWNMGRTGIDLNDDEELLAISPLLKEIHASSNQIPHEITFLALGRLVSLAPRLEKLTVGAASPHPLLLDDINAWPNHYEAVVLAKEIFRLPSSKMRTPRRFRDLVLTHAPPFFVGHCIKILDPVNLQRFEATLPLPSSGSSALDHLSFTALRYLAVDIYDKDPHSVLASFLQDRCTGASLKSLTLRTVNPIPETILPSFLDAHGSTLNRLYLQNDLPRNHDYKNHMNYPVRMHSIRLIRDKCPKLKRLSLCVPRGNDNAFDTLATFPSSLRHLTLNFGSGFSFVSSNLMQEGADINAILSLPKEDIEDWEKTLWLHMPITTSSVENIFRRIWKDGKGASSLESLVVKIRHPWGLHTRQEFLVQRAFGGSDLETTIQGYRIPQGQDEILAFDGKVPRMNRLKEMWREVCPGTPFPEIYGKVGR
ncbi:hypothetical protein DL96DRAFT_1617743 [Flagelloscypha sp. PMI_526]|nr:hypothetical protein DL96DRAFT_1617743 [Flagelloscypha sp. PMI_526]